MVDFALSPPPLTLTCCLLAPVSAQPELTHLVMAEAPGLPDWSRGLGLDHGGEESSREPPVTWLAFRRTEPGLVATVLGT